MKNLTLYKTILENLKDNYILIKDSDNIIYYNNKKAITLLNKTNNNPGSKLIKVNSDYFKYNISDISVEDKKYSLYQYIDVSNEIRNAIIDPRTNALNMQGLNLEINEFIRKNKKGTVIMVDLDNFKQINDNYSHNAGDFILKEVSKIFLNTTSENDLVVRYGGDEFLIISNSPVDKSLKIAEDIRNKIDSSKFKYRGKTIHATATIGVKEFSGEDDITKIVDEADILMYVGKNNGKNQITNASSGGIHPRMGIGQKKDGTFIFVVVDGRQPGYSIGTNLLEMQNIFNRYDAYNAANLDGGSSATMYYNGKVVNKTSTPMGERYLPNAFIVKE